MSQLDAQESSGIGWDSSGEGGTETGEEGSVTAPAVDITDDAANSDVALGGLEARLDGVDGEDGNPHGNTSTSAGAGDGSEAQLTGGLASDGVLGAESALDILVGGEVGSGSRTITSESGDAAAEDGANTAFAVELANDVHTATILGLFAGGKLLLALNLENNLDSLKGGGDSRHGNGGEEASGGELGQGEAIWADSGDVVDELFADIITPEGDGD